MSNVNKPFSKWRNYVVTYKFSDNSFRQTFIIAPNKKFVEDALKEKNPDIYGRGCILEDNKFHKNKIGWLKTWKNPGESK